MELAPEWMEWGLWGLFLASFLAATVLPFSSEALLLGMALSGWPPVELLVTASIGNWIGGMSSYGLGRWGGTEAIVRWTRTDPERIQRWKANADRWGAYLGLLCWAPVVGDVIAIALGLFRVRPVPVAFWMLVGKAARYAVVLSTVAGWHWFLGQ